MRKNYLPYSPGKSRTIRLFPDRGGWSVLEVCCTGSGSQICDSRPYDEARAAFYAAVKMWSQFSEGIRFAVERDNVRAVTALLNEGA